VWSLVQIRRPDQHALSSLIHPPPPSSSTWWPHVGSRTVIHRHGRHPLRIASTLSNDGDLPVGPPRRRSTWWGQAVPTTLATAAAATARAATTG
jgi:hypothetical protein